MYTMEIFDKMFGFVQSIPKPVIIAVVILALLGIFLVWKKTRKDSENEVEKSNLAAREYSRGGADVLAPEREPLMASQNVVGAVGATEETDDDSDLDDLDDELEDVE